MPTVDCLVRARLPTPHGEVYLHAYAGDEAGGGGEGGGREGQGKEHLAIVFGDEVKSASLAAKGGSAQERWIRGATWEEEAMDRRRASVSTSTTAPLVRIHSECYTGETLGSQRCDCGEQLDEAMRLMAKEGRGVVVYLRQEGRGIGLTEKLKAYNLQDLGHDTVDANLILGHSSDKRRYDVAKGILDDLGLATVRLLTNNPDKISQIESLGIAVAERVAMVPRSWINKAQRDLERANHRREKSRSRQLGRSAAVHDYMDELSEPHAVKLYQQRRAGVGMIGGSETQSSELDRYLQAKIEKMGHILDMPAQSEPNSPSSTPPPPPSITEFAQPRARTRTEGSTRSSEGWGAGQNGGRRRAPHPLSRRLSTSSMTSDKGSMADSFMSLPSLAGSLPGSMVSAEHEGDKLGTAGDSAYLSHAALDQDELRLGEKTSLWIKSQASDGYPIEETFSDDEYDSPHLFPPWSDERYSDSDLDSMNDAPPSFQGEVGGVAVEVGKVDLTESGYLPEEETN